MNRVPDSSPRFYRAVRTPPARYTAPPAGTDPPSAGSSRCPGRFCADLHTHTHTHALDSWRLITVMMMRCGGLTGADALQQFGVVLSVQQRAIIPRVPLHPLLRAAGHHPHQRPVLVRDALPYVPLHCTRTAAAMTSAVIQIITEALDKRLQRSKQSESPFERNLTERFHQLQRHTSRWRHVT